MPRLAFGLGRIHHLVTSRSRQDLIAKVIDIGFRGFDVAPAYGNGLSEAELARFIRQDRDRFTVTSKFGIPVSLYGPTMRHVFPIARAVERATTLVRGSPYARRNFSAAALQRSLDGTLHRLRTDYVDRLYMHEPLERITQRDAEALTREVERLKREGKIVKFGVAGPAASVQYVRNAIPLDILQIPLQDILSSIPAHERVVAYGVYRHYLRVDPSMSRTFVDYVRDLIDHNSRLELVVTTLSPTVLESYRRLFE